MERYLRIIPMLLLLLTVLSCSRGKEIDRFYISEEMKSDIPFQGRETISFFGNDGDIVTFVGGYRISQEIEQTECISCYDYAVFEEELINFNNGLDEIRYTIQADIYSRLTIRFSIGGHVFNSGFYSPLSPYDLVDSESFIDSLIINNSIYYNVYKDTMHTQESTTSNQYPVYSYYTKEYGIIKIDFSDSTYWELKEIRWTDK